MDRIHRLGQHRPVTVVKMAIEDSIESKIIQLQEKKVRRALYFLSSCAGREVDHHLSSACSAARHDGRDAQL